jgi:hypothetical protein
MRRRHNGVRIMSESMKHAGESARPTMMMNQVDDSPSDAAIDHIREALRGLRYGMVSIIVQDGVVVQIERTEKRRLR